VAPLAEGSLVDGLAARALGEADEADELLRTAAISVGGISWPTWRARPTLHDDTDAARRH